MWAAVDVEHVRGDRTLGQQLRRFSRVDTGSSFVRSVSRAADRRSGVLFLKRTCKKKKKASSTRLRLARSFFAFRVDDGRRFVGVDGFGILKKGGGSLRRASFLGFRRGSSRTKRRGFVRIRTRVPLCDSGGFPRTSSPRRRSARSSRGRLLSRWTDSASTKRPSRRGVRTANPTRARRKRARSDPQARVSSAEASYVTRASLMCARACAKPKGQRPCEIFLTRVRVMISSFRGNCKVRLQKARDQEKCHAVCSSANVPSTSWRALREEAQSAWARGVASARGV